ncbi:MAG: sugar phosphate isomerase/epimerase [Lachnospiraceae bacterium]|jgi:2-keto-myo-inositol isomerase|nr:sugar phosphate isomerase/epimerase [Lachnospiraceae bacterium]
MKISYNEACGLGCSTLEQDLELCEAAGFDYIEIRFDMLMEYLRDHRTEELAAYFATHHIKPHAFNALYLYPEFLREDDDPKRRAFLLGQFLYGCEIGHKIGNHHMIVVPPFLDGPNYVAFPGTEKENNENCIRMLRELGKIGKSYDMNLCFELVGFPRSSVRTVENAKRIVEAVALDNVGYVFDAYNLYLYNGKNDYNGMKSVEKEKIFAVHLNSADDVPERERKQEKRCFVNEGVVDIPGFLGVLREIGYEGMCSVEIFRPQYWKESPQWVVQNAYETTRKAMSENHC